eukprot:scaffold338_cov116-Cylindrotheca_fusiformis.AAC.15
MGAEETTTTTRPTTPTSSSSSTTTTTTDQQQQHNLGVVFQLIDCREWEGVISFFNKVPEAASIGRIYKENVENLALHEVVRQQNPPLTVINLLLELNPTCISHRGHEGNLPLHYACANKRISNTSNGSSKILNRLLEAYPTAVRMRNDDDALPIHLACQHQQQQDQEESIKILLQYFPEGYYLKDADDFTPADYITVPSMKQSMERLVPILIQTARAATQRTTMEYTVRERGIQEAHAEFIRQMKERQDEMEQDLLVCQLELQDQLTVEKERNITLVEQIVQLQHNEQTFIGKMNQLTNTLQQERTIHQEERERTKREYKRILNITTEYDDDNNDHNNNDHNNTKNPEEQNENDENDDTILSHLKSLMHHRRTHEQLLNEMSHDLTYNSNMVRNLNELLSSKEEQIQDLQQQQTILQRRYEESIARGNRFEQAYEESQKECMVVRDEMQKLAKLYTNQQDQLTEANRIVRVQDSRLASIKSLAQSLNINIESWALDDQQQQQQQHEEEADKDEEEDEEEWEQQQQQKTTHQQQQHQQQHSLPPPKESPPQTLSSATTFQVLEGMEAIRRHSSRGRGGQQGERASPSKVMAEDYYSLKTNDTSMSTRPSSDDDDITSLRLTMMTSPPRTKTTTSTTTNNNNNTNPTTTTTTSNNNSSSTTMTMAMTPSRYREEYG